MQRYIFYFFYFFMLSFNFLIDFVIFSLYYLFCFFFFTFIDVTYFFLFLFFYMLFQILVLLFIPKEKKQLLKDFTLKSSLFFFFLTLFFFIRLCKLDSTALYEQYLFLYSWDLANYLFNMNYVVGVDGLAIFFVLLTSFLTPICVLVSWNSVKYRVKDFLLMLIIIEFLLINVFVAVDLFYFFVFFECVLIPMFFMIGVWGSRQRKIHAVYQFFIYTLFGSIFLLIGILIIQAELGTTNYLLILNYEFSKELQLVLWLLFFIAFAVKVPMFPFHIWLPEAHVEAPTAGSVILAGLLLKLGTYGFLRFSLTMFPYGCVYFKPLVYTLCVLAVVYTSITTIRQIDLKKIIAYSSIGHMNFVILGLFTSNLQGLAGSIYLMLSHGFVSSALFICVGLLYDRYHTRIIFYYRGLAQFMPLFAIFFFFFSIANVSFPGTSSFVGELLILLGLFEHNIFISVLACLGVILGVIYSFWLYNRIMFGNSHKVFDKYLLNNIYADLSLREFVILSILAFFTLLGGLCPNLFLNIINMCLYPYIELYSPLYFNYV